MSDGLPQFPKHTKGRVDVRHRTGAEAAARREAKPPEVERIKAPRRKDDYVDEAKARQRVVRRMENETSRSFILVAVSLCILMVAGVIWFLMVRPASRRRAPAGGGESAELVRGLESEVRVSSFVTNATAEELDGAIEAVVRGFMSSATNEERCRWVNGGAAMLEKMTEYYSREEQEPPKGFDRVIVSSALPFGGVPVQVVQAAAPEGEDVYLFNVFPGKERMLIDWESSVGYGEMSWDSFLEQHPTEPVEMRVFLLVDDYYNYEFSDDQKYQSFSIGSKGNKNKLFGYVERGSVTADQLALTLPAKGALPVRIRMKFLPWSGDKKMVWIEELIHAYWVDPATIEATLEE